ncbi:MAG: carbonic anhydrase [Planctomycetota bacterium]
MKKLLRGIAEFRRTRPAGYEETFARLALTQAPDALLICCADSRVAPNVFASVEPGDLLVVRNIGNLVPRYAAATAATRAGASVPAAIELAIAAMHVRDVVVCGHSSCAAMRSLYAGEPHEHEPHLAAWLRHGAPALEGLGPTPPGVAPYDHLSQRSVRLQLENLRSYPIVREAEAAGKLRLNAWWFDIARAEVLDFDAATGRFVPLDEARVERLLAERG